MRISSHNLLDEVEKVAFERQVQFRGLKKCAVSDYSTKYHGADFENIDGSLAVDGINLVAGTAWAFAPEAMNHRLDYLSSMKRDKFPC